MNNLLKLLLVLCFSVVTLFASIDFNSASIEELMSIKGIGEKKAQSIIEYRKDKKIEKVEDLKNIKGFGDKLVTKIKLATK